MSESGIVDAIYGAGFGEGSWDAVTELMLRDLGVCWANVMTWSPDVGALAPFASASSDVEWTNGMLGDYAQEYWRHDPVLPIVETWGEGVWLTELDTLPVHERKRNPFLQEFVRGNGMGCIRAVRIPHPDDQRFYFSFFSEQGQPSLDALQQRRVNSWSRHLSRAIQATALMRKADEPGVTPKALDHSSTPIWVVRQDGIVLDRNAVARALMAQTDSPVHIRRQRLVFASRNVEDMWALLRLGQALTVQTSSNGAYRFQAFCVPPPTELAESLGGSVYLVCATRLGRSQKAEVKLTLREVEVLQLVARGLSYKETASLLKLSAHTVSSHIRSSFLKLGCTSKAEAIFEARQRGVIA